MSRSRRLAAWADLSTQNPDGTFYVAACEARRPGSRQLEARWTSLEAAKQEADRLNSEQGLSHQEVVETIASSMFEHNAGWRSTAEAILYGENGGSAPDA